MSSINNDVLLSILGNMTTAPPADQLIAPAYKAIKELSQAEYEELLHKALVLARQTASESKIADPQTMLAILAVYGIQEVHSLGFVRATTTLPSACANSVTETSLCHPRHGHQGVLRGACHQGLPPAGEA